MRKRNIILYIILLVFLFGCNKLDQEEINLKEKKQTPEILEELNLSLDKILDKLGELEKIELNINNLESREEEARLEEIEEGDQIGDKTEENDEESSNMEDNEEANSEEANEEDNEEENEEGNKNEGDINDSDKEELGNKIDDNEIEIKDRELVKDKKVEEIWNNIDKTMEDVHSLWGVYGAEGIKKGGNLEQASEFDNSINKMTKAIENKNIMEIYDYASQGFLNLKPFLDLYRDDYQGEIAELKYSIYQYYLQAINGNRSAALRVIRDKEENIQRIKSKIEEDDEDKNKELDKISYLLKSLTNSLNENSRRLYMIKKDVVVENLRELEK